MKIAAQLSKESRIFSREKRVCILGSISELLHQAKCLWCEHIFLHGINAAPPCPKCGTK